MAKESYEQLINKAQKVRKRTTKQNRKEIRAMYRRVAESWKDQIERQGDKMTTTWLMTHAGSLEEALDEVRDKIEALVKAGVLTVSEAVIDAEASFWSNQVMVTTTEAAAEALRTVYASYPEQVADELIKGSIYKGNAGISSRIWSYTKKQKDDISHILQDGIMNNRSAYDIAKDLERYVKPGARKPWDWSKVYPWSTKTIDYNAQRLSRTAVTHAYQLATVRSTEKNPYITKYQWHSSNSSRTCEICTERDGRIYTASDLPLDHPNGMCTITCIIEKDLDEIARDLRAWADGEDMPEIDEWIYG